MSGDDLSSYFEAAAAVMGLQPLPAHRDEVFAAFLVLMAQSRLVTEFSLPEDTEAAPRFSP